MNPATPPSEPYDAHDALFDEIERELAALIHAPLVDAGAPDANRHRCVDEFATDFLNWSMPPRRDGPLRR
jgi:hypothetical protein